MAEKINFKLKYNGATHRFNSKKRDFKLLRNVKKQVAAIVKEAAYELFWKDDESAVALATTADLRAAMEYAMRNRKSQSKTPRIKLVVRQIGQSQAVEDCKRQEESATAEPVAVEVLEAATIVDEIVKESLSAPVHDEPTLFRISPSLPSASLYRYATWSMAEEKQRTYQMMANLSLVGPTGVQKKEEGGKIEAASAQSTVVPRAQKDTQTEHDLVTRAAQLQIKEKAFKLKEEAFAKKVAFFEWKMEQMEKKFAEMDKRMGKVEAKVDSENEHFNERLNEMEERLVKIEEESDDSDLEII